MSAVISKTEIGVGSARAWILATRPQTLLVGAVPVMLGAAAALRLGAVRWSAVIAALFGSILIQIGTNLANDVFDYEKGTDTHERIGPLRVTQAGLLSARQVRTGMIISFALAALTGVYLTMIGGLPIVIIGLASIASGVAYTGGPYPLGYHGLGDIFVMVFFGPVAVCGTTLVASEGASGRLDAVAFIASLAAGALATGVLVVNNVRDIETDVKTNKRTLAVRFGRSFGVGEYAVLVAVAMIVPIVLVFGFGVHIAALASLVTLPFAVKLVMTLNRERAGDILNRTLANTAKLLLAYGVLLSVGIALSARS
jgi:1,4-dihydroxy-2-naphthoate octaprenyltransferase